MKLPDYRNDSKLKELFGLHLKSSEVIDLLETSGMDVIYQFDRLNEGVSDSYSSASPAEGFEFRFDERQVLETIWCYIRQRDGFSKIDSNCIGTFIPSSLTEVKAHAVATGQRYSESLTGSAERTWLRLEEAAMWTHYEFIDGELSLVTLMRPWN